MRRFKEKDFTKRFIAFVGQNGLIIPGDRLLAAHSGGSDSTFLFEMLLKSKKELGFEFCAGHVNHGLRGEAADDDENFVRRRCEEESVRFLRRGVSIEDIRRREGISIEMTARKLRYDALEEMAAQAGCNKVAFAHQADDRIETFLLRLLKGAGPDGLASIPLRRPMGNVELIRPLFAFTRAEIIGWLHAGRISYRTDESNLDTAIARNAVRGELLPLLEERFNPSLRKALLQTIEAIERDSDYLNRVAVEDNRRRYVTADEGIILDLNGFGGIDTPVIVRMLLESFTNLAGEEYRCGYDHLIGAVNLWLRGRRNDRIDFPGGWTAVRVPEGLLLRPTPSYGSPPAIDAEDLPVVAAGECSLSELFTIKGEVVPAGEIHDVKLPPPNTVYLRAGLAGKLKADHSRSGRYIRPLGMGGHTRKVSDVLMEAGVPPHRRAWVPLLIGIDNPDDVHAIPHLSLISESAKVGNDDAEVFVVEVVPPLDEAIA